MHNNVYNVLCISDYGCDLCHERDASTAREILKITFKACRLSDRSGELRADRRVYIYIYEELLMKEDRTERGSPMHLIENYAGGVNELFFLFLTCATSSKALIICRVPINCNFAILFIESKRFACNCHRIELWRGAAV